jgi:hypothetical protein
MSEYDELLRGRELREQHVGGALEWDGLVDCDEPDSGEFYEPDAERRGLSQRDELLCGRQLPEQRGQQDVGGTLERDRLVDRDEPEPERLFSRPVWRGVSEHDELLCGWHHFDVLAGHVCGALERDGLVGHVEPESVWLCLCVLVGRVLSEHYELLCG